MKNHDNNSNRADAKWDFLHFFLSGFPGALCSKHSAWFWHRNKKKCWCDWDQATLPATAEPFPAACLCCSPAVLHPCLMPVPQHARHFSRVPQGEGCDTWPYMGQQGGLALSPAFPVCIGSEKNRNYINKPYICRNSHFPRGLLMKNKDGWLPGKVYRDFCMCFSNQPKRDDMDGCSKGCQMGAKQPWCLPAWALCLARAKGAVCLLGFMDRGSCFD